MRVNIAIDGPSGSGKSTLARAIAQRFGIYYLDTGSMYRAVAYAAVQNSIDISNESEVEAFVSKLELQTQYSNGHQQNIYNGEDVMPHIRTPQISSAASDISAYPCVRHKLVAMQREVAENYDVVLDGRDIGTFVLPKAKHKFFVTAAVEERAKRRFLELTCRGIDKDYDEVLNEMRIRDNNDSSRSLAPLKQADDAVLVDTTNMSIEEAIAFIMRRIEQE